MLSDSHRTVCKISSVKRALGDKITTRTRRTVLIIRSHNQPWWLAWGWLKTHSIARRLASRTNAWRSSCRKARVSSLCVPTMFVPLSENTRSTWPRRATNLINPLMNESVVKSSNFSMWTAREVKHEYIQAYLLTFARPTVTKKGPNISTPQTRTPFWKVGSDQQVNSPSFEPWALHTIFCIQHKIASLSWSMLWLW